MIPKGVPGTIMRSSRAPHLPIPHQERSLLTSAGGETEPNAMNRLSVALFVVTGLMLTAYFGTAAWRLSTASNADILDGLPSVPHTGWSTTATRR